MNNANDRRRPPAIDAYFGDTQWFQFSLEQEIDTTMVTITMVCHDTVAITGVPTLAPSTPAPTLAPTEGCKALFLDVDEDGVQTYNGIYNQAEGTINGNVWWIARNDIGATQADTNATIYFSTSHDRWVIEAPDVYWEANQTQHSLGQFDDENMNYNNNRRFPPGSTLNNYFGRFMWFQFSLNYGSKMVGVEISCYDTKFPTLSPSVAPTTPAPTLAPTEECEAIFVKVADTGTVAYNGIYNKQDTNINGQNWWVARDDVGATNAATNATVYFSSSHNRWVIEAADVYWEANQTQHSWGHVDDDNMNNADDRRRFPTSDSANALDYYFGETEWFQFSLNYGSKMVSIDISCYDTRHPTLSPSVAPTTPAPTLAPTEICQAIFVKVTGIDTYNGVYNKQDSIINGYDWWVARNDVGATDASSNPTLYFSSSHNRWVIEATDIYWEAPIHSGDAPTCVPQTDDGYNISPASLNPSVCGEYLTPSSCMSATWESIDETEIVEGTTDQHPEKKGVCVWVEGDRRQSQGISTYFVKENWNQVSLTLGSSPDIAVELSCFDTRFPTLSPSIAPTTPAPTLAPTEECAAIDVIVSNLGVTTYNGIYNKADGKINGYNWWVARDDVSGTATDTGATLYFSTSHNRWVIEAPDVYWEANITAHSIGHQDGNTKNTANDQRLFPGTQAGDYFGKRDWFQFSLEHGSMMVAIDINCRDTKYPTLSPSVAPTTPAPTLAPTEICDAVFMKVTDGVTVYDGIYNKQDTMINGYSWWVARDDVGATGASSNATIYYSSSHERWVIEAADVYFEANQTQHSIGHSPDDQLNNANDQRRFPSSDTGDALHYYFGETDWFQFSLNYGSKMVKIDLSCFDTIHPTLSPSVAPTTPAPTLAPTETCDALFVKVTGVETYNGIYNKQASSINGYEWWVSRDDVGSTGATSNPTLYFSSSHNRWVLEASDVYWEAPIRAGSGDLCVPQHEGYNLEPTTMNPTVCAEYATVGECEGQSWVSIDQSEIIQGTADEHPLKRGICVWVEGDRRQPHGISDYFGKETWHQVSLTLGSDPETTVEITCYDTKHPTLAPSVSPTTPAPTLAPTEECEQLWLEIAAEGVVTYNGLYNKQIGTINGFDWWVARDDVGGTAASTDTTIYFSTSHDRWVIEAPDVYWEANQTQHSVDIRPMRTSTIPMIVADSRRRMIPSWDTSARPSGSSSVWIMVRKWSM